MVDRTGDMSRLTIRVEAPHFVAGAHTRYEKVFSAAPILKKYMGWREDSFIAHCKERGWKVTTWENQ